MSAAPATRQSVEANGEVAVEIEVRGRWEALALSEQLIPFHSFLVQHGPDRWVVHARSPGWRGEPLDTALAVIGDWRAGSATEVDVRVDGRLQRDRR